MDRGVPVLVCWSPSGNRFSGFNKFLFSRNVDEWAELELRVPLVLPLRTGVQDEGDGGPAGPCRDRPGRTSSLTLIV